jgi:hypothetical protein
MSSKTSKPTFIKIDGNGVGLAYTIQNYDKIPKDICPITNLPPEIVKGTVWEDVQKKIAICPSPILAPIPFGVKISTVFPPTMNLSRTCSLLSLLMGNEKNQ